MLVPGRPADMAGEEIRQRLAGIHQVDGPTRAFPDAVRLQAEDLPHQPADVLDFLMFISAQGEDHFLAAVSIGGEISQEPA
jgi:hypothetical protein